MTRSTRRVPFPIRGIAIAVAFPLLSLSWGCAAMKTAASPAGTPATPPGGSFHGAAHPGTGGNPAKLGKVLVSTGQYDKAIVELDKAIQADPNDFRSLNFRGVAWFHKGDIAKAMADTTRAIEIRPDFADAYNTRGYFYLSGKQYDIALADFDRALSYNYRHEAAFNHRGLAWMGKGEYEKAIADFARATEIDSRYVQAWMNKGEACEKAGRIPEALEAYRAVVRLATGPAAREAQAAEARIRALETK